MKKQFVQAAFCAPTGAYEDKGLPTRLTDEVFKALADAGINRLFGFGYDGRPETIASTFKLCEKYKIAYFPTPSCAESYVRICEGKNGEVPFSKLSEEEIAELDEKFEKELLGFAEYPAFGGVFFSDEAGYLAAEGIAYAKKVFDRVCSDYEFHTNFYSYSIDDNIFWGGMGGKHSNELPFELTGDMAIRFENRFNYYDCLVENLLSKADFEYTSQDKYPFEMFWPEVPTSVHVALFELNAYFNEKKQKYNNKFYNYMQVGNWTADRREVTFAEMALQMHVTAAYGSEGFAYFPACYPVDYIGEPAGVKTRGSVGSMIDMDGHKTLYCSYIEILNRFFRRIEEDILDSTLLGVKAYGTYDNGFDKKDIENLPDNECIYCGELPEMLQYDGDISVDGTNQVLVATFEREDKRRYYFVNLSTIYRNDVSYVLPDGDYEIVTQEGTRHIDNEGSLLLNAGCGVYIKEL